MISTPLEQFEIVPLWSFGLGEKLAFTNSSFFLCVILFTISAVMYLGITHQAMIIPTRWQSLIESTYEFVYGMISDTIGAKGEKYFPFIYVTFIFIVASNLVGMTPYCFTVTSHILITFSLGMATFVGINIVAFREHGLHFLSFFLPQEAPLALSPLLVMIESISYIFRVFSLSIRLFANMMAGHTLLKILAGFAWTMLSAGGIFYVLHLFPLVVVFALTGLELGIAALQAYVWTVLVCIYLADAIHLH
jgi:ATP synthase subunit 6